ncbi:hypothetical protein AMELA_G00198700 [Ameiurus melas]|uniref:C2H2-type domain-containing protein n=1 Tax=Ameiurus melas TaxID=219545 RepID=A0A7J6A6B9_AMEME|nr:hypothetical protein AMELA_G00198700 [Ameiurus melas]
MRSCDHCKHGWVMHALSKLRVCSDQVEVVHSGVVCELSALILFSTHAFPVRMKILLDRLFSVLTHQHVFDILHTHGWTLHDYIRGYKLQDSSGKVLDCWLIMTPEDELVTLRQFLRFGETKSSAELMISQREQLPLPTNGSEMTKQNSVFNTSHNLQTNGIIRGRRSPGSSHSENLSGGVEECSETPSSLLLKFPSELYQIQQDPKRKRRENAESEAAIMTNAPLQGGEERKTPGAKDQHLCSSAVRKSRVSCVLCGKTFYDRGTLKIHYNAVHLKIKHRCTIEGCDMLFSSLRSRNRHSANPNPRLHNTHSTQHTHSMTNHWALSQSSTSPMKIIQEVTKSDTAMLAPVTTSSFCTFANINNYMEMIDQDKMSVYDANSAEGVASTPLWTNQKECKGVNGATARKKSRKSTMPVKIERESRDEDRR